MEPVAKSHHKLYAVTAEPPLNEGASHVRPIYEADVIATLFAREVGGSGI